MAATVADVIRIIDAIAPAHLAESWDNVGLQVGGPDWPVQRVWTALDVTGPVVDAAADSGIDAIVAHHPLLMKPLGQIRTDTPTGKIIQRAIAKNIAIVAAHTNLDAADGGLNDFVARRLNLSDCHPLVPSSVPMVKLVFFAPQADESVIVDAIRATPAGRIGTYEHCTFSTSGIGAFEATDESQPVVSSDSVRTQVTEVRIETIAAEKDVATVVEQVRSSHPYQTMAYDIFPLKNVLEGAGVGRVGRLESAMVLSDAVRMVMAKLEVPVVRHVGDPGHKVSRVALCTGSGGSLMPAFLASGADLYISGDLSYHHARDAQAADRALLDVGHFGSERWVGPMLAERLTSLFERDGIDVTAAVCPTENDPFITVGDVEPSS